MIENIFERASNGDLYCAEQISGGWYLHTFVDREVADNFIKNHPGNWVKVSQATGRRMRPDQNHGWEELL